MLDQDADGDQELVLSLGSPYRGFAILDLDSQGRLVIIKKIRPDELLVGSGLLYSAIVDYDNDGMVDMYNSRKDGIASVANYLKQNGWKTGSDAVSEVSVGKKYEKLQDDAIDELELPFNLNNFRTKITTTELLSEGFKFNEKL